MCEGEVSYVRSFLVMGYQDRKGEGQEREGEEEEGKGKGEERGDGGMGEEGQGKKEGEKFLFEMLNVRQLS